MDIIFKFFLNLALIVCKIYFCLLVFCAAAIPVVAVKNIIKSKRGS